jgi:hypothetical protein
MRSIAERRRRHDFVLWLALSIRHHEIVAGIRRFPAHSVSISLFSSTR